MQEKTLKIGLSGAQGTGKTTLMNVLRGSKVIQSIEGLEFLPEIVRELKAKYNIQINELGTLETEMMVMTTHLQNLIGRKRFISDRCLVDNMLYATASTLPPPEEYTEFNKWLVERMIPQYDIIFYIPVEFDPPEDGVRNLDKNYYDLMKNKFEDFYSHYEKIYPDTIVRISGQVMDRVFQIENVIKQKWQSNLK
jgi:GTPase SAR1 family protein